MIAAAVLTFAACSQDVLVEENLINDAEQPFIFEAFADKTTRADEANSTNLYDFYKTFDVYGFRPQLHVFSKCAIGA